MTSIAARFRRTVLPTVALLVATHTASAQGAPRHHVAPDSLRPFGTQREWAERQQRWLALRLERVLPALMRRDSIDMWIVPMREYNEDPVFSSLVAPTTFAARRRTIYVFFDRGPTQGVERIALGGTAQGGLYRAVRASAPARNVSSGNTTAELWGAPQWDALRDLVRERKPRRIAVNTDTTFAFADGLSTGEFEGLTRRGVLDGDGTWRPQVVRAGRLAVDLIASRLPEEEATFAQMNRVTWDIIQEAFSERVIVPGTTRTSDVVWWMRQRVADLGLTTWFQPSVTVQRRGATGATGATLGEDPVIQRGDVLHCDFGITAMRLNTDTQHMGYVLREGETAPPAGLVAALGRSNRLQDIHLEELRPGRTGNAILASIRARMQREGIDGTIYSHPIGLHGHGAGALVGLWDYQEGVPGRGDHVVIPGMWYSIELQATTPVAEWDGQPVRMGQEEDVIVDAAGRVRWGYQRQVAFHLVRAR
jgi:hypothetical protein